MLDNDSLRTALALLMGTLLVLFYFITYRTGKSPFAGWWCLCLAALMLGSLGDLTVGTPHSVWALPIGQGLSVLGTACVWAAGRSLRFRRTPWWWLAVAPVVAGVASALDDPLNKFPPAGGTFFACLWITLGLATMEMGLAAREARAGGLPDEVAYRRSLWALVGASAFTTLLFFSRWVAYVFIGPDRPPFTTYLANEASSLAVVMVMTTVAFNMSTLSDEQYKRVIRELAARDGLTGLLNRIGFLRLAEEELERAGADECQLILADLDHFKRINDEHGHPAGDRAIVAFAEVCTASVRSTDLVGRYGGEEFVLLLRGATPARAEQVAGVIRTTLAARAASGDAVLPTASFGIATAAGSLDETIERADRALYRAKDTGRDRTIHHADMTGPPRPRAESSN